MPLGEYAEDTRELGHISAVVEAMLRYPRGIFFHLRQSDSSKLIVRLAVIALVGSLIYGGIVGSFSGGAQLWVAPAKISLGMIFTAFICLPSLYIFACLGGSRAQFHEVIGLLAGQLALTTLLLIGFAPVAWIFSRSTESAVGMGALHLLFWLVSVAFGARLLKTGFATFGIQTHAGIHVWLVIFLLVVMQMTAALRPLIGDSDTLLAKDKKFFLTYWFECMNENVPPTPRAPYRAR